MAGDGKRCSIVFIFLFIYFRYYYCVDRFLEPSRQHNMRDLLLLGWITMNYLEFLQQTYEATKELCATINRVKF